MVSTIHHSSDGSGSAEMSLTVIIPTCNRRSMLGRCLQSVLAQTQVPLEIIVVNDAGESVEDIIAEHNASGIIRYVEHPINKGASAARNTGLHLARGAFIAYLDDDDTYLPSHLETMMTALSASSCRFGYSFAEYVIDDFREGQLVTLGRVQPYSDITYSRERLLVSNFIPTPTWVFSRTLLDEVGYFDESFAACEDWEWLIRASEKTDFLRVPQVTVEVRQRLHDDQHLIVKHRSKMNAWINAVYAKHPVSSPQLRLARYEHVTFGAAKKLSDAEEASLVATFHAAENGMLDSIALVNATEMLTTANLRYRAIGLYQAWLRSAPPSPVRHAVFFNLAVTLKSMGEYKDAELACRQALQDKSDFSQGRFLLVSLLEQQGHVDEAIGILRNMANQDVEASAQLARTHLARLGG